MQLYPPTPQLFPTEMQPELDKDANIDNHEGIVIGNADNSAEKLDDDPRELNSDQLGIIPSLTSSLQSVDLLEKNTREQQQQQQKQQPFKARETFTETSRFLKENMTIGHEQQGHHSNRITTIGKWRLLRTIGKGATSKVKLAEHQDTKERRAVKLISRKKFREQWERSNRSKKNPETVEDKERRVLREASIMYVLRHPNILPLLDFHITPTHFIMFFEYVEGVRMLDFVQCHRQLNERVARKFFKQLVSAVDYLHNLGIVHRDLKIENVMVEEASGTIRLIDFGLSNFYDTMKPLTTYCGSLYFAAPELLHGRPYCGPEVDIWSLGVILFVMITGQVPFDDANVGKLHDKIKAGQVDYPHNIPRQCKHLLERLLVVDSGRRASMTEVMNHPWITENGTKPLQYATGLGQFGDILDEQVIERLADLFSYEFPRKKIMTILHDAGIDWYRCRKEPIVLMYLLLKSQANRISNDRHSISDLRSSNDVQIQSPIVRRTSASCHSGRSFTPNEDCKKIIQTVLSVSPLSAKDMYPLHAPSLKGILTSTATSFKSTTALRREIIRALETLQLRFDDRLNHFIVEYRPKTNNIDPSPASVFDENGWCKFEVHMVHGMGMHWLQFHRVSGDHVVYKAIQSRLQTELNL